MKLAIHNSQAGFHPRWVEYCKEKSIEYKIVNCYANNIIEQLKDCDVLFWHFSQSNPKDIVVAKQILFALEHNGFKVFPNFKTAWHFDDKVGQKYLLEAINAPMVPSYVFFDKTKALEWADQTKFPKVFKLRGGAGSANVKLAKNKNEAKKLIKKSFGSGFSQYEGWTNLKERLRKFKEGKSNLKDVAKGVVRLAYPPYYSKVIGKERGYVYFQDFIPNNDSDIRIIIIDGKAFGLKRYVRENDFRASGSGNFSYNREEFDERCIKISFDTTSKLQLQCAAFDFVFDTENNPLLVEVSYGFSAEGYDSCPGYWDKNLKWHEGKFNPQGWMLESILKEARKSN